MSLLLWVWAPHNLLAGTMTFPMVSLSSLITVPSDGAGNHVGCMSVTTLSFDIVGAWLKDLVAEQRIVCRMTRLPGKEGDVLCVNPLA